ncbi:hypothetical protein LOY18_11995, partial [Staphylococcus capitis]
MYKTDDVPIEYLQVWDVLKNSDSKYLTKQQIIMRLGRERSYWRKLTQIISDLVAIYGFPIGSDREHGVYICKTREDYDNAIRTLGSYDTRLEQRAYILR